MPSRTPTSRSPSCVSSDDRAAHDLAEADVAVGGLGDDAGVRAVDGDVAVGRVDPQVAVGLADPRVAVGVLDHRAAVELAEAHVAGAGRDLGVARGTRSTAMSPAPLLRLERVGLVELDAPRPVLMRQSPSGPSQWRSPTPRRRRARASRPAARSSRRSTRRRSAASQERSFGALTSSCPSAYSTRVCSAALHVLVVGRVARAGPRRPCRRGRSALIRTSPTARSMVAEIGPGVSKVGMAMPSCVGQVRAGGLAGGAAGSRGQRTQPV